MKTSDQEDSDVNAVFELTNYDDPTPAQVSIKVSAPDYETIKYNFNLSSSAKYTYNATNGIQLTTGAGTEKVYIYLTPPEAETTMEELVYKVIMNDPVPYEEAVEEPVEEVDP